MIDIFVSPHADDIAYSCFGSIHFSKNEKIIVTVFSLSRYAYNSSKNEIEETTNLRKMEDKRFADAENSRLIFLDFSDTSIYMPKSTQDDNIIQQIEDCFLKIIVKFEPCNIFIPIAIGWHLDHHRTRNAILSFIKKHPQFINNIYLYEDLPYACDFSAVEYREEINKIIDSNNICSCIPSILDITDHFVSWENSVKIYDSQFDEIEYVKMCNYKRTERKYFERLWRISV
jgi:LmbE family N-acetylglucosaminyl deacetylase